MVLQGDYGIAMLKYRCGMLHCRRACRPSGVYPRSGQMLAVPLQVKILLVQCPSSLLAPAAKGLPGMPDGGTCREGSRQMWPPGVHQVYMRVGEKRP